MAISLVVYGVLDQVWQTTTAADGQAKLVTSGPLYFQSYSSLQCMLARTAYPWKQIVCTWLHVLAYLSLTEQWIN